MRLPIKFSQNSLLSMLLGIAFVSSSFPFALDPPNRVLAAGLFLSGIATVFFGATHGFADRRPIGHFLYRLGLVSYVAGIPLLILGLINVLAGGRE